MRFKEALDTTMNIDKEFETNYDFIQYGDDGKQSFTAASIIKMPTTQQYIRACI